MKHELKTWPESFHAIAEGRQLYSVRRFDREFAIGDQLLLREWEPRTGSYTGRAIHATIKHITPPGKFGMGDDFGVLGLNNFAIWKVE
jgi:hypothetical protein